MYIHVVCDMQGMSRDLVESSDPCGANHLTCTYHISMGLATIIVDECVIIRFSYS